MADPLVFSGDVDFTADLLNQAFASLSLRLKAIEGQTIDYKAAIAQVQAVGLDRLEEALRPVYDSLITLGQLGAVFTTTSATPGTLSAGTLFLTIASADWQRFAAAGYLIAQSASDPSSGVSGRLQSYDPATGALTILVDTVTGTDGAAVAAWNVTAGADFAALRAYVDGAVASAEAQIIGGATAALDTFGEVEARIQALIGSASAAGDTLGELQATIAGNLAATKAYAKRQAIIFG